MFCHADRDGPCGYEVKNRVFTGFAHGSEKGLCISRVQRTDTALVLAESAIERLAPRATVRIAADNVEDGAGFAALIQESGAQTGRRDLAVERAAPADPKDWNDVLKRRRTPNGR